MLSQTAKHNLQNCIPEDLINTGTPIFKSQEFVLGGGVDFKTSTKIANCHVGGVLLLHLIVNV